MPASPWSNEPVIFEESGEPATSKGRFERQQREQEEIEKYGFVLDREGMKKICIWCGQVCESIEALEVHEEECA